MLKKKVVIIIQARMLSVRLPNKVMLPVLEQPLLGYLLERIKKVQNADTVVVATTTREEDKPIVDFCHTQQVEVFRGAEEDVLQRYLDAAQHYKADVIVRITADCPLMDPSLITKMIHFYLKHDCDYVSNTLDRTYPRGMDVEVFSTRALEQAAREAQQPHFREHVTLYMYRHPEIFHLANVSYGEDCSGYRFTVDTDADYKLVKKIIEALYPADQDFTLEDILNLMENNPALQKLNAHIQQKTIKEHERS